MKTAPFRECSLEMSGPFSGALKDGVSLKAILSVNIQGGGCLSAFAIRAWWRMIIAAEEWHLQEVNLTFFTFFSSCWLLLSHSPKLLFWCRKKNMFSILTYPNPFPEISSGCHEIKGSLSHQSDHTYLLWNLNRPYETLIYTRLLFCTVIVFLMCHQPQNNSFSLLLDESETHTNLYYLFILNFS